MIKEGRSLVKTKIIEAAVQIPNEEWNMKTSNNTLQDQVETGEALYIVIDEGNLGETNFERGTLWLTFVSIIAVITQ